ncbi:MAG: DNA modification methylase [Candidatus Riesia sp.]|nr:DNA modification methylase [Candidatus Riesia sp.]
MKFDCKYDAMLEIEKIVRHPRNNNMHPIEQIEAFQRIISKKGVWRIPLIISKKSGFLVAGHLRLTVAESMGLERLPVVYQDFESEADEYQFLTFDNEIARWAKLDRHEVHLALEEIEGLELDDLGIQGFEIQEIKQVEGEDDAPEVDQTKTVSTIGDIWILGNHRVMCGDSTVISDVERLMDGQKADMVFTDPPYGVNYTKKTKEVFKSKNYTEIKNDDKKNDDLKEFFGKCFSNIFMQMHDATSYYVCSPQGGDSELMMMMMMRESGMKCRHQIIWVKDSPVFSMGRLDYDYQHEPILYGWTKKHSFYKAGKHKKSVWNISRKENKLHPTMKPVELVENAILNSTQSENNTILDVFGGSGSTLIACEKTNRKCFMMELDPKYVDVIINRWQDFTGKEAVHINGKKFNEYL